MASPAGSAEQRQIQELVDQVERLKQRVQELSEQQQHQQTHPEKLLAPSTTKGSRPSSYHASSSASSVQGRKISRVVMVNNLPLTLANPDSVYLMMERFGTVERVKLLHNRRTTALVQMATPEMAERAVTGQAVLAAKFSSTAGQQIQHGGRGTEMANVVGSQIFLNFSDHVDSVRLPEEVGLADDGLSRDYTSTRPKTTAAAGALLPGGPLHLMLPGHHHHSLYHQQQHGQPGDLVSANVASGGGPILMGQNGPTLLVSSLPEELASCDALSNLCGFYGDVKRVKILRNKPDCGLVQMAKPHHAATCRSFLDRIKVRGRRICVSFSRINAVKLPSEKKGGDGDAKDVAMDEEDCLTKDYSDSIRRFRNPVVAKKLLKNLCAPTSLLHVANLPDSHDPDLLKAFFVEHGFTVSEVRECGKNMALVRFASVEEAILALAKLHNSTPEKIGTKNANGICLSFSGRKISDD